MPSAPLVLHLPFRLVDVRFSLAELLAADPARSAAEAWRLLELFALSAPEERFARRLLSLKRNLWLYRCNQRAYCGDFLVVDMSPPDPAARRALVLELKAGAALKPGGGGLQVRNAAAAAAELEAAGVLGPGAALEVLSGSEPAVLAWLRS